MPKAILNKWNGSMVNDPRDPRKNVCRVSTNFDTLTNPKKLTPYRQSEDGDNAASTSKKQNFVIALRTGTTYRLYALGVKSGTGVAEVLMKDLTTGGSQDLGDNSWLVPNNNQSSGGTTSFALFIYYKRTELIYGAKDGTTIWAFDPTSVSAFDDAQRSITYANIAQGLVHSKDRILYIPYDNKIARNNNGSWTDVAITIDESFVIKSISEYGNYLAIGAAPVSGIGNSRVYLWDRDASLETLSENIDWGEGVLTVLEQLEGHLVGVSLAGNIASRFDNRIIFNKYNGSTVGADPFEEFISSSAVVSLVKQKADNRILFAMDANINGSIRYGVWSIGRSSIEDEFSVNHERTSNNDTALSVAGDTRSFYKVGDFMFISYILSNNFALSKTDNVEAYTNQTAIRETTINPGMRKEDRTKKKQLIAVRLVYEKLPENGQAVLQYKMDAGSFVEIFTETTDGVLFTESRYDVNKKVFPISTDIEFRMESIGAEIAELVYEYDIIESQI